MKRKKSGYKIFKLKDMSLRIVIVAFAILLIALGLVGVGILGVSQYILPMIKLSAVVILFIELGLVAVIKRAVRTKGKDLNFLTVTEFLVGVLVLLETILSLAHMSPAILSSFSGWILMIFGVVFAIEAFVK